MNILELDSFNLADAVKFNDKLNPRIWQGEKMRPEVREQLLKIAADFRESLGVDDLDVEDITISGSNAGYTYTPHSDIDLHLVVRMPDQCDEVYQELFNAKKYQYNDEHDIKIGGYDVELYVQPADQSHVSAGVYSLKNDDWIHIPRKIAATAEDAVVKDKYDLVKTAIDSALKSNDIAKMRKLWDKIKEMRQAGLAKNGELGPENLAFKMLRTQGDLGKLKDSIRRARDAELSLNERKKKKKKVKYGFTRAWAPAFDFSNGEGGDAGVEEDVSLTPDGVSPSTRMFLSEKDVPAHEEIIRDFIKYVRKEIGLKKLPKFKLHKDPQWSIKNQSFGRYAVDTDTIDLSIGDRHIMDILRTLAHELQHRKQDEREQMPADAGATGSPYENEAHVVAGVLMRNYADMHPEYFEDVPVNESVLNGNKIKEAEKFNWADWASIGMPMESVMDICESYITKNKNLLESNNPESVSYFKDLFNLGKDPQVGKKYLMTLLLLVNDNISVYQAPIIVEVIKKTGAGEYSVKMPDGRIADFPHNIVRNNIVYHTFFFNNKSQYEKLKTAIKLKFDTELKESSGYIPTKAQANDPRFKMALTVDVHPGQTGKEANKMALKTDSQGKPGLLIKSANLIKESLDKPTPSAQQIIAKHGMTEQQFVRQITKGIQVELEHTSDVRTAKEIALDHINEIPDYYDRLAQAETEKKLAESLLNEYRLIAEQDLTEIKMSTASLRQEAAKTGAQAGMEFEMIVPNVEDEDLEPEYERDEDRDRRARNFSDIEDFFYDGDYNGRGDIRRLMEKLDEAFQEWKMDQIDMDWANEGPDYLRDYVENYDVFDREEALDEARDEIIEANPDLSPESEEFQQLLNARINEMQEQFAEREFDARGRVYDDAREAFIDEKNEDYDESDFLEETTPYMSDVENEYDITWPYYYDINDGRGGEMSVDQVADDFSAAIGRPVNASSSYHGGRREPGKYVVEPDGSLDADNPGDGGLEFVSPPLPIDELITDLNKVKKWAGDYGCYTNDSTGLHINISVPDYSLDKLDYVKLALLMGDEYVLDSFGRSSNTYTAAATGKIRDALKKNPDLAPQLMDKMRGHMEDLATKAIHSGTTNKYTSINTKNGYIEFRSPGGDWLDANFDKIENTLLRFTVALSAAIDPEAYRQEYLKKLYKFLESSQEKGGVDVVQLFANYSAGDLDKAALIRQVRQKQLARNVEKGKTTGKMWWEVSKPGNFASIEVVASSKEEAISKALEPGNYPEWASARNTLQAEPLRPYQEKTATAEPATPSQGNWGIWMSGPGRFARAPGQSDNSVLRRFPSREAAEQFITQTRAERPDMRTDIDVREIEPAAQQPAQPTTRTEYQIFNRNTGEAYVAIMANNDQHAIERLNTFRADHPGNFGVRRAGATNDIDNNRGATQPTDFSQMGSNTTGNQRWQIFRMSDGRQVGEFNANNHAEAERHMERTLTNAGMDPDQYDVRQAPAAQPQAGDIVAPGLGEVPAGSNQVGQTYTPTGQGSFTGQWLVVDANNRILYKFGGIGNSQGDANNVAIRWLSQNPAHMQAGVEVVPEMD